MVVLPLRYLGPGLQENQANLKTGLCRIRSISPRNLNSDCLQPYETFRAFDIDLGPEWF